MNHRLCLEHHCAVEGWTRVKNKRRMKGMLKSTLCSFICPRGKDLGLGFSHGLHQKDTYLRNWRRTPGRGSMFISVACLPQAVKIPVSCSPTDDELILILCNARTYDKVGTYWEKSSLSTVQSWHSSPRQACHAADGEGGLEESPNYIEQQMGCLNPGKTQLRGIKIYLLSADTYRKALNRWYDREGTEVTLYVVVMVRLPHESYG